MVHFLIDQLRLRRLPGLAAIGLAAVAVSAASAANAHAADLRTYGYSLARKGVNHSSGLTRKSAARLTTRWHTDVAEAVNTQPLVAHGVRVGGRSLDLVYVGTEHGAVIALDATTGEVVWRRRLGAEQLDVEGCAPSPDNWYGITGTLTLDRSNGRIYAVDERGRAWALALDSGRPFPGWPVQVTRPGTVEYVWGGLALSQRRLYVAIGSLCDSGSYQGGVVAIETRHPDHTLHWNAMGSTTFTGAGVWGWGGVAIDRSNGDVYVTTGNAFSPQGEAAEYAEHLVRLGPKLKVRQSDAPLRPPFAIGDRDFGGSPVLFHAKGCPRQLVVLAKTGDLFLYDRDHVGRGPQQRLRIADVVDEEMTLIGLPAFDPSSRKLVVLTPVDGPSGNPRHGLLAYQLSSACRLSYRWQHGFDWPSYGSQPMIANGVVFIGGGFSGAIRAYSMADGHKLWDQHVGTAAYAAPAILDGTVYGADWDGGIWAFRPG